MGAYCSGMCHDSGMRVEADSFTVNRERDWQYVKFTEQMGYILLPHEDGTFELVMAVSSKGSLTMYAPELRSEGQRRLDTSEDQHRTRGSGGVWDK